MPHEDYAERQEAIVAEEYNGLPQADKFPDKQMWTDLSLEEKFTYLLLDMRESRLKVIHQEQLIDIYQNTGRDIGEDSFSDSVSDSEYKKNEAELNQETKKRKQRGGKSK
jgi:hypothetical protein